MTGKHTIVINGKVYDAMSGLPVAAPSVKKVVSDPVSHSIKKAVAQTASPTVAKHKQPSVVSHAGQSHSSLHKSKTLRRDILKKPASTTHIHASKRTITAGHVAKSPSVHKFAPHPQPLRHTASTHVKKTDDIKMSPIVSHTLAGVVEKRSKIGGTHSLRKTAAQATPQHHSVARRQVEASQARPKKRLSLFRRQPKAGTVMSVSIAVMALAGYFTYLAMPSLSVKVAASQAGLVATYPSYQPDGYRFDGPVAFSPGQVAIKFQSNSGNGAYTITQQKSGWDSRAVYDNIVASLGEGDYVTNSQQGLTIYTYNNHAAWVNRGILYTVSGEAPLSNDQLLRIASSM